MTCTRWGAACFRAGTGNDSTYGGTHDGRGALPITIWGRGCSYQKWRAARGRALCRRALNLVALTITGTPGQTTLRKSGAQVGDVLILTKPLGTGVILAGAMRGIHVPGAISAAVGCMDSSNALSVEILQDCGVNALTDYRLWVVRPSVGRCFKPVNCGVALRLADIPMLPGALPMAKRNIASSLQGANALALRDFRLADDLDPCRLAILSDPQTSGGMLASVPAHQADTCIKALRDRQIEAARIGDICPHQRASSRLSADG